MCSNLSMEIRVILGIQALPKCFLTITWHQVQTVLPSVSLFEVSVFLLVVLLQVKSQQALQFLTWCLPPHEISNQQEHLPIRTLLAFKISKNLFNIFKPTIKSSHQPLCFQVSSIEDRHLRNEGHIQFRSITQRSLWPRSCWKQRSSVALQWMNDEIYKNEKNSEMI